MPRSANAPNTNFSYEVIINDKTTLIRTQKDLSTFLEVSPSTIRNYLKLENYVIRKYKNERFQINRIKKPIFEKVAINY
tara:strand:- start:323 stop:559 length:237 start_codon:yes stop_codon:yes gene_type:complete